MRDNALKLVAGQKRHASTGDADDGIAGRFACREGIDRVFAVHHKDGGNRNSGSDRHFLHDIEKASFVKVSCIEIDFPPPQFPGNDGAATGELCGFEGAREKHDQGRAHSCVEEHFRSPKGVLTGVSLPVVEKGENRSRQKIDRENDPDDSENKIEDEDAGFPAGLLLMFEKIHPTRSAEIG